MKQAKLTIKLIENKQDVNQYQMVSEGGIKFPVGTVLVSGCIMGQECSTVPFIPDAEQSGIEQFAEWQDLNVLGKMEGKK